MSDCGFFSSQAKSSTEKKRFQCSHCAKRFRQKHHLDGHKIINDKENAKMFECEKCTFKTIRLPSLRCHRQIHGSDVKFKCQACRFGFNRKQDLDRHILSKHEHLSHMVRSKIHRCRYCPYITANSAHLKSHYELPCGGL